MFDVGGTHPESSDALHDNPIVRRSEGVVGCAEVALGAPRATGGDSGWHFCSYRLSLSCLVIFAMMPMRMPAS